MATELGQAFVQIMPSAKGISGSIQKTLNPEVTAAGKSAGSTLATTIANSMGKAGKTLTAAITVPALGAATAIGGLVGVLGFKRLIGMDNAQAKLKGLGIEGKQLEVVMESVKGAVTGTTHTMAEGVDTAAGALASGVKQGADLERYIKLVGDAAIGANRPMDEMAMIFNRVQGGGRLMTRELNMIEMGMPGFSQAMADNLADGSLESFREMVTNGEVGSDEFLNVMEGFAGGMSDAFAGTWQGMTKNILSNIGIIGEALLDGLFEDGKQGMAEFLDFLRNSEGLKEWATETGEKIRKVFNTIVEVVKGAIQWWTSLDGDTKKLITTIAGIAVAIGPVLMILSKLITVITIIAGAITTPVLIAVGVIAGLIAIGVLLYKNWETIKEKAIDVFSRFEPLLEIVKGSFQKLMDSVGPIMESLKTLWESLVPLLEKVGIIVVTAFGLFVGVINGVLNAIGPLVNAIINFADIVVNMVNAIVALFTGDFAGAWDYVQNAGQSTMDFFKNMVNGVIDLLVGFVDGVIGFFHDLYMTLVGNSIVPDMVNGIIDWFKNLFKWGIDLVKKIVDGVVAGFNFMKNSVQTVIDVFKNIISVGLNYVKNTFQNILAFLKGLVTGDFGAMRQAVSDQVQNIKNTIKNIFGSLPSIVTGAFSKVKNTVKNGMMSAFNTVTGFISKFKDAGRRIVTSIADGIKGAIGRVTGAISDVASKVRDFLPFSPPKTGPLMDIMDVKWGETIGGGIEKGESTVAKAMEDVLAFDLTKKATFSSLQRHDSGRDITIHNTFTSKEMTPSEISRKQRQQLEQLALGW